MSLHFIPLSISDIRRETADAVSIAFEIPTGEKEKFLFHAGQNITLRTFIEGKEVRRSYSICSAPHEAEFRIAVKKVPGGLFSVYANEKLRRGDVLEVLPPTGRFYVPFDAMRSRHYLAIAAGSGITPILSLIKSSLYTEPHSHFTLLYGNRNRASILFFEELEALKNRYPDRFQLIHVLSREHTDLPIHNGRIGPAKCQELTGHLINFRQMDAVFICGPEEMIFSVKDWLEENGTEQSRIHFELFTTPGEKRTGTEHSVQGAEAAGKALLNLRYDGRSMEFMLDYRGSSILEAALEQGLDLPYSCKGGVCSTCKARVVSGQVTMDANWALEPEELAQGYILTCQAHPASEKLDIDFDLR